MNIPVMQRNIMTSRMLEGKVSLITGSTSGIGLGIARALAAAGSSIVLNGFGNPQEIAATRSRLDSEFKVGVDYSPADMSKPEAIRDMVDGILKSSGRLDVVVNNAGIQHVAPIPEFPVEKWQAILGRPEWSQADCGLYPDDFPRPPSTDERSVSSWTRKSAWRRSASAR